jgi:tetratricopeptide (TPR) repeat protein
MSARTLALLALLAAAASPVHPADGHHDRATLVRRALDELHRERFADALATAEELRRLFPDDPAGALCAANVHQTMMRDYRLRDREAGFLAALAEARRLAEAGVRAGGDAEAFFARGTAHGYIAIHDYRCGRWFPAFREARWCLGDMKRAVELDPDFADPLLALALHDYWKSRKLGFGIGLHRGLRRPALARMETVWRQGRYLTVEAAYTLSTVHQLEGRFEQALAVSDWLYERFPDNPVCLYHRGLILERLDRPEAALGVWDRLVERLLASGRASHGFLAECHLHRAGLLAAPGAQGTGAARGALRLAADHARARDPQREMEGPFGGFEKTCSEIARTERQLSRTVAHARR